MDAENVKPRQREKLNTNKINFIKRNIEMIKNQTRPKKNIKTSTDSNKPTKTITVTDGKRLGCGNKTTTRKPLSVNNLNNCVTGQRQYRDHFQPKSERKLNPLLQTRKTQELKYPKQVNKLVNVQQKLRKPSFPLTPQQKMHKKLVRRSINHKMNSQCKKKGNVKSQSNKRKSVQYKNKQLELQKKLNNYLVSKGRNPKPLRGFTPTKIVLTPKNSPARQGKSRWPGLRDEDSCNEILVLLRHVNGDVDNCIERNTNFAEVLQELDSLAKDYIVIKNYAQYWIMILKVKECMGASYEEAVQVYEDANTANAQPISDVQQQLVEFLENHEDKPNVTRSTTMVNDETVKKHSPSIKSVSTSPFAFPQASNGTPFVLRADRQLGMSPLVGKSSSVVKFQVIPQSSPIFKRMISRNMISHDDARAIVTPVRRSCRIADSAKKSLRPKEHNTICLPSIADVVNNLQIEKCEIAYQSNEALTDDMQDICTMLEF